MAGSNNNFEKITSKKVAIKGVKVEKDKDYKIHRAVARRGKDFGKWQG